MDNTSTGTREQFRSDMRIDGFNEDEISRLMNLMDRNGFKADNIFYLGCSKNSGFEFARKQWLKQRFVFTPHLEFLACDDTSVRRQINDCIDYVELWRIAQKYWSVSQLRVKPCSQSGMNWVFVSGSCDLIDEDPMFKPAKYGATPAIADAIIDGLG